MAQKIKWTLSSVCRFLEKIRTGHGCWEWQAYTRKDGYGSFRIGRKIYLTHRLVWDLIYGPIDDDICVCHHCDNPKCCRPAHLFLGTVHDNVIDREYKNRGATVGSRNSNAKLTPHDIKYIRSEKLKGASVAKLARQFGVSTGHAYAIIARKYWTELEDWT